MVVEEALERRCQTTVADVGSNREGWSMAEATTPGFILWHKQKQTFTRDLKIVKICFVLALP